MTRRLRLLSLFGMLLGLALPTGLIDSTFAQREGEDFSRRMHRRSHPGRGNHLMRMARWLDLSDTQKEQMRLIADQFRDETADLREQIRIGRREVHQSLLDGTFNEAEAGEKLAELGRLEAQLMGYRNHMMQETKLILTPDQLDKLEQARERMQSRRLRR